MATASKRFLRDVHSSLLAFGARDVSIEESKHFKVRFTLNGHVGQVAVSKTPSDHHAIKNSSSDLRRVIRDCGVENWRDFRVCA